ncbi:MAG: hypothetical protein U1E15_12945 [Hyphomicrobiales bacterium]
MRCHRGPCRRSPLNPVENGSNFRVGRNNYIAVIISVIIAAHFFCISAARAKEIDRQGLVDSYLAAAFGSSRTSLVKFANSANNVLRVYSYCDAISDSDCETSSQHFTNAIRGDDRIRMERVTYGDLMFVITNDKEAATYIKALSRVFSQAGAGEAQIDVADPQCQLFTKVSDSSIVKAEIVASIDSDSEKLEYCLLISFYRALGLSFSADKTFDELWTQIAADRQQASSTPAERSAHFLAWRTNALILEHIHQCPKLHAGMSKNEVQELLTDDSICLKDILSVLNGQRQ